MEIGFGGTDRHCWALLWSVTLQVTDHNNRSPWYMSRRTWQLFLSEVWSSMMISFLKMKRIYYWCVSLVRTLATILSLHLSQPAEGENYLRSYINVRHTLFTYTPRIRAHTQPPNLHFHITSPWHPCSLSLFSLSLFPNLTFPPNELQHW